MDIKIFDGGLSPSVVEMYHIRLAEAFYDLKDRLWYRDHFKWNQEWDQDLISDLYRELSLVMRVPPKDRMLGSISMMTRSLEHRLPAHVDAHKENQRSVLFCLNSKWNTDWGGEILFFEGDEAHGSCLSNLEELFHTMVGYHTAIPYQILRHILLDILPCSTSDATLRI